MPNHPPERAPLLAFGAHPDDIEFGCGGVVALETRGGRPAHLVVCSRGESATHGTPAERTLEAERGAPLLVRRSSSSSSTATPTWKSALRTRSGWRACSGGSGRQSCWRRASSRTSTRTITASAVWSATRPGSRDTAGCRSCATPRRTRSITCSSTRFRPTPNPAT